MRTHLFYLQHRDPKNPSGNLNAISRHTVCTPLLTAPCVIVEAQLFTDGVGPAVGFDIGYSQKGFREQNVLLATPKPYSSLIEADPVNSMDDPPGGIQSLPPGGGAYIDAGTAGQFRIPIRLYIPLAEQIVIALSAQNN